MKVQPSYRLVLAGAAAVGLVLAIPGAAGAAPVPAATGGDQSSVIVILKNQHTELNARTAKTQRQNATRNDQAPLVDSAKRSGASNVKTFSVINGFAAKVSPSEAASLRSDPSVAAVVPDRMVPIRPLTNADTDAIRAQAGLTAPPDHVIPGTCPTDPSKPLLEPEALQSTQTAFLDPNRPQAQNLVTGKGVKVAWIADGLDPNNPDFIRPDGSHVFTDYEDFSGTDPNLGGVGAEAFGDASSIAAQGRQVYDLSQFVNAAHPLPPGCNITVRGVAPGASLVGINVFGNSNSAPTSRFIEAIDYAVTDGADVLNESFGGNPFPDTSDDPITLADDAAIAAGVTVVASTGDAGPTGTVGSPGSSPDGIISVAATTSFQSYIQETFAGAQLSNGTWISNNISGLSSGGVTQSGGVPDLAAPGDLGW